MDNSHKEIRDWLEGVFKNCDLDISHERGFIYKRINAGIWWRGNISEYLRDKYGQSFFLRCNLYL